MKTAYLVVLATLGFVVASGCTDVVGGEGTPWDDATMEIWTEGGDAVVAWVFFEDKGVEVGHLTDALGARRAALSPRALQRRLRIRADGGIDERDLDVAAAYVSAVTATGARHRATSRWLNAVSVEATEAQLDAIEALAFVSSTRPLLATSSPNLPPVPGEPDPGDGDRNYGLSQQQLDMLGVTDMHECGFRGEGILIGVQDTGFSLQHEALADVEVLAEYDFVNDDENTADEGDDMEGHHTHGTGVLSLLAGWEEGDFAGAAPEAVYILSKTEDLSQEVQLEEDYYVQGLEWIEGLGADIFSSALGYVDWYSSVDLDGNTAPTSAAAQIAAANGLILFIAAGNVGPEPRSLAPPADADGVITVGAVDFDGVITDYSSRGPTADGRTKPDVVAPGDWVWMAEPSLHNAYTPNQGTSFATPLAAGVGALVLQSNPGMTPAAMWTQLTSTASQFDAPDNDYGWGLINAMDAAGDVCPCEDQDGDGYNDESCGGSDCQDLLPNIYPGAAEICDGFDTDCDGEMLPTEIDEDGDGHLVCEDDCDDNNGQIHPDAEEIPYDGFDQDCDGEDLTDVDGDGVDGPDEDCDDTNPDAYPGAEENCYDDADNDCDGKEDSADSECEGTGPTWEQDRDGCSCRHATNAPRGPVIALVLLAATLLRRR